MSTHSNPETGSRHRLTADDRRLRILAAAREVLVQRGIHGARTRDLAEAAGVSEALLFRHFPTKLHLVRAIVDAGGVGEQIERMESLARQEGPREGLTSLARHFLTRLRDDPDTFRLVFFAVMETPELAHEFYSRYISRILGLETVLFQRALAGAGVGEAEAAMRAPLLARSFHGSLMFYNISGAVLRLEPPPEDPEAMARFIVNIHLPEDAR